ncbi:MAG TPA: hypothetical protein VK614_12420 [Allosphingosinicella sp.]|nr:hypothetical protein [Allosphingosinicella sp.]
MPRADDQILFLHGWRAGSLAKVSDTPNSVDAVGFLASRWSGPEETLERVSVDRDLFAVLPLAPIPDWCPPFNIRRSFILDELAVWFCNRGLSSGTFHWKRDDIAEIVRVCWQKRLAISPSELSAILMAHGMPAERQAEIEDYFEFGVTALVSASGRKAVKKWRQADAMRDEFSAAMRLWGR